MITYESIASQITSAALASKPTISQYLIMLVKSSRPPGWTFGPILYGIGAIHSGTIPKNFSALAVCLCQIATLSFPLCVVVFSVNDIYDYASDILNPRKSVTSLEGTILPPAHHAFIYRAAITASVVVLTTSVLPSFFTPSTSLTGGPWQVYAPALSTSVLVALGWMYSAPPARLKEIPIIDSFSNGLIVWLSWFIGFASCRALGGTRGLGWAIGDIPSKGYVLGLVTASVHALGAAADIEADLAAGQRTIGTVLGIRGCAALGVAAYTLALTTEPPASIFGVYLIGGSGIMISVCLFSSPAWVHHAFKFVVCWTVTMAVVWFGAKLSKISN